MSWRDRLRQASFRGVPFLVDNESTAGEARLQVEEYIDAEHTVDPLGTSPTKYEVEAFLLGEDYDLEAAALRSAVADPSAGRLVHPTHGSLLVHCQSWTESRQMRQGGRAGFRLTFIPAGRGVAPTIEADSQAAGFLAAAAVGAAASASFASRFNAAVLPQWARVEQLVFANAAVRALGDAVAVVQAPAAIAASVRTRLEAIDNQLDALLSAPASLAAEILAVGDAFLDLFDSPGDAYRAHRSLLRWGNDIALPPGTSNVRQQQQTNQREMTAFQQRAALAGAAKAAFERDYESHEDALAVLAELTAAIDRLTGLTTTAVEVDDDLYEALAELATALRIDLRTRAARLPRLVDWTPPSTMPALVVAQRLYGDASRDEEIVARNRLPHPAFVTGGVALRVLSDA